MTKTLGGLRRMNSNQMDSNYSILFTSLEEYRANEDYEELFNVLDQTQVVREQQEFIDTLKAMSVQEDSTTFTKS